MESFSTISAARAYASRHARQLNHAVGIEAAREFGRTVYRVGLIPNSPAQRFGWETRCEPILPTDPLWEDREADHADR